VESDYSQAGFYYAAKGVGNEIDIQGLNPNSHQGDRIIVPYYEQLLGDGEVVLDVSQCPDLVPALAVQAALRPGQLTRIINAARLRIKESDRLDTVTTELNKLGAQIEQFPDSLTITGVEQFHGGEVSSHNDHRIAMMLAMAATRATEPVTILDAGSVRKSYPNFWEDYETLGGQIQRVEEV
jgi:3-phosphoshikimate 1-carboxyvinyltransferase